MWDLATVASKPGSSIYRVTTDLGCRRRQRNRCAHSCTLKHADRSVMMIAVQSGACAHSGKGKSGSYSKPKRRVPLDGKLFEWPDVFQRSAVLCCIRQQIDCKGHRSCRCHKAGGRQPLLDCGYPQYQVWHSNHHTQHLRTMLAASAPLAFEKFAYEI